MDIDCWASIHQGPKTLPACQSVRRDLKLSKYDHDLRDELGADENLRRVLPVQDEQLRDNLADDPVPVQPLGEIPGQAVGGSEGLATLWTG